MDIYLTALLISLGINLIFFVLASSLKTDKFTDFTYGISFIVIAAFFLIKNQTFFDYQILLFLMVTIWAIRLITYLLIRVIKTKKDSRFDNIRNRFFEFLKFWLFQGIAVFIIMLPAIYLLNLKNSFPINGLMRIGILVWFIGLTIETISDMQKFTYKINLKRNQQPWINSGLWRYSRHPNYFGEMTLWWGIFLFALPLMQRGHWFLVIGPLFITFILRFVSGIPPLEKRYNEQYKNNSKYQQYKKSTSLLIPLPPQT